MLSNLLKTAIFVILCFLMLEQSYRVYSVGWTAFSIAKMNSLTSILNSGLIELSDDPEIYYQLKPNLDTYYKGIELTTNSYGLADKEYALEKPPGTFRVAVVGSSWSMASGAPPEASYHALLEQRFSDDPDLPAVEFINFSVEYYSLHEITAIIKKRVPAWDPDLILVPITFTTAFIAVDGATADRELPPTIYPFFASFTLRELNRLGVPWPLPVNPHRETYPKEGMDEMRAQLRRSMLEINDVADSIGARTMIVWLGFDTLQRKLLTSIEAVTEENKIILARGDIPLQGSALEQKRFHVSRFDRHPNSIAHLKIADVVESAFIENELLSVQVN